MSQEKPDGKTQVQNSVESSALFGGVCGHIRRYLDNEITAGKLLELVTEPRDLVGGFANIIDEERANRRSDMGIPISQSEAEMCGLSKAEYANCVEALDEAIEEAVCARIHLRNGDREEVGETCRNVSKLVMQVASCMVRGGLQPIPGWRVTMKCGHVEDMIGATLVEAIRQSKRVCDDCQPDTCLMH